jgi:integral membrane protein
VPGLPTTVFFIVAAACFSRSSPRFEQWVLTRPVVGPMVRDYRAGLGMPRRAKVAAITSIAVVCAISAFVARERWWLGMVILAAGAVGVAWIAWRVPTRPDPGPTRPGAVAPMTRPPRPAAARAFFVVAVAEACSWVGLLAGMYAKYVADSGERGVEVFGRIHGIVVLAYVAVTLWTAHRLRWDGRTLALGLLASVPPLATVVFERWASRSGRLDAPR